jgi:pimeloyl-ACP methyl ester carboxylesterase
MLEMLTSCVLFKPPPRIPLTKFREDSKNILIRSVDGDTIHCHLVCPWDKQTNIHHYTGTKNVILFLHGNNEDVSSGKSYCQWLADKTDMNVITCDYPGYGFSTGQPSEQGISSAAVALLDYTLSKLNHKMHEIILLGKSLGSTPAIHLASQPACHSLGGIILVSPVASAVRCLPGSSKLPNFILTELDSWVLPNIKHIGNVSCPVQFIHGLKDDIVPCCNSHMLLAAMRSPPFTKPLYVNAGHNDIESKFSGLFMDTMKDFLEVCSQRYLCQCKYEHKNDDMDVFDY